MSLTQLVGTMHNICKVQSSNSTTTKKHIRFSTIDVPYIEQVHGTNATERTICTKLPMCMPAGRTISLG